MKNLISLILCIIFTMLLFSGCKKTAENPPTETTEASTAPTENTSETIKPNTGPIITTRPTEPSPTTEPTEPSVDPYPQYVQTDVDEIVMIRQSLDWDPSPIPFRIPKLLPFSEDAIACQEEIQGYFGLALEQARKDPPEGDSMNLASIDYSVYLNDTILSLVIRKSSMMDLVSFRVYNFDIETGKRLDTDGLVKKLQMTDYTEKLSQAVKGFYEDHGRYVEDKERVKKYMQLNTSAENLAEAIPYVAEDGKLMAVVKIYYGAGAEYYPTEIPIT